MKRQHNSKTQTSVAPKVNGPVVDSAESPRHNAPMGEIGIPGLTRFGNFVLEEFIPILRWPRAGRVYREMASNDPVIGSILFTAEMLIRKATWTVVPGGSSPVDLEAAQFLTECMDDMNVSWAASLENKDFYYNPYAVRKK